MLKKFIINSKRQLDVTNFDPEDTENLSREDIYEDYLNLQKKFIELQNIFCACKKYSMLIVLQGMDCSGKDGTVKKAFTGVDPNGFNVKSFKEPSDEELSHDYLWRVHKETPKKGNITIFNRSYYEDVLVTRVHETIDTKKAFSRFDEINMFEKYLTENDTIILKFFLHISKDFQKKKLENRLKRPEKHWKFSAADLRERKYWDNYQKCYSDVLSNCSTDKAPWIIVPANNRWFRDYLVLDAIVNKLSSLTLNFPELDGDIHKLIKEVKESQ
ncbi:MAG: polyphosphate kinase 2 family protein [Clostridium sp.]|nr:polyphosphate kinase 2 family protein [Clostridium sp.]